jgi:glutaredoxin-related protein
VKASNATYQSKIRVIQPIELAYVLNVCHKTAKKYYDEIYCSASVGHRQYLFTNEIADYLKLEIEEYNYFCLKKLLIRKSDIDQPTLTSIEDQLNELEVYFKDSGLPVIYSLQMFKTFMNYSQNRAKFEYQSMKEDIGIPKFGLVIRRHIQEYYDIKVSMQNLDSDNIIGKAFEMIS